MGTLLYRITIAQQAIASMCTCFEIIMQLKISKLHEANPTNRCF